VRETSLSLRRYKEKHETTRPVPPFVMYGKKISPKNLGTRSTFADIGATILDYFDIAPQISGSSMLKEL
jgi:phosphopentomutase